MFVHLSMYNSTAARIIDKKSSAFKLAPPTSTPSTSCWPDDRAQSEKLYSIMMDLSKKMHFTDSTIASHMGLYARGFDAGFPRKPMSLPPFDDPKYREIRAFLQAGFDELSIEMETGDDKLAA